MHTVQYTLAVSLLWNSGEWTATYIFRIIDIFQNDLKENEYQKAQRSNISIENKERSKAVAKIG